MAEYATPGVYVEEVPAAVKPIAGVGTSTAGFIGIVEYGEVDPTVEALTNRTLYEVLPLSFSPSSGQRLSDDINNRIKTQFAAPNTTAKLARNRKLTELQSGWQLAEMIAGVPDAEAGSDLAAQLINQIKQQFPDPSKTVKVTENAQPVDKLLKDLQPDMVLAEDVSGVATATQGTPLTADLIAAIKQQFPDPNKTVAVTETVQVTALTANMTLDARLEVEVPQGEISENLAYLINESSKTWETAKKVKVEPLTPAGRATLCTNFGEFTSAFGSFSAAHAWQNWLAHAVYGFFNNGGSRCWVIRADSPSFPFGTAVTDRTVGEIVKALGGREVQVTTSDPAKEPKPQAASVTPTANGDNLVGKWLAENVVDQGALSAALDTFKPIDEIALVAIPGAIELAVHNAIIDHCEQPYLQDRFAILDGIRLPATTSPTVSAISSGVRNSSYGALYFPWITVVDPNTRTAIVPPSGHLAGVYARVDTTRGVHKAPANEVIRGALDVERLVSKRQQEGLNPDGINVLRKFDGNVTVWGARTWAREAEAEWRYINVRRLFLYLRKSIDQGTQWVVFEPNDPALWAKIRRNVTAFLTNVWRAGALFGATPQEAFYVKCDAETNPPELRDLGRVVTEVGVAVVKPAEFVVFRISQWAGPGR